MGLHQVLVSMGRYSPQLERKLLDLADALEVQTAFGNDAIITAEKYLATYSNISNDVLPRALKVTLDLARGWNIDLRTAANIVGKASMGLTAELTRYGITLSETAKKTKDFGLILRDIESQVSGQAAVWRESAKGVKTWFKVAFGDVQKQIGYMINEVFKPFYEEFGRKFYDFANRLKELRGTEEFKQKLRGIQQTVKDLLETSMRGLAKLLSFGAKVLDFIGKHPQMAEMGLVGTIFFGRWGLAVGMAAGKVLEESGITSWETFKRKVEELFTVKGGPMTEEELRETVKKGLKDLSSGEAFKIKITRMEDVRETESALSDLAKILGGLAKEFQDFSITFEGTTRKATEGVKSAGGAKKILDSYGELEKYKQWQREQRDAFAQLQREITENLLDESEKRRFGIEQEFTRRMNLLKEWLSTRIISEEEYTTWATWAAEARAKAIEEWNEQIRSSHQETFNYLQEMTAQAARSMQQSLSDFFFKAVKGELDSFREIWAAFLDSLLRIWSDYMAQLAATQLFGQEFLQGKAGKPGGLFGGLFGGGGLGGLFSGLFSFIGGLLPLEKGGILPGGFKPLQHGGIITKPTLGLIGEGPYPEAVVPLPGDRKIPVRFEGGRPGQTVVININAVDARSFEELCRRNPGAIVQPVLENINRAGVLRAVIRETV